MSMGEKPWRSSLLERLGVRSVAIQTTKPAAKPYTVALIAAMTVALGSASLEAFAGEKAKQETAREAASATAYGVIGIEDGDGPVDRAAKVAAKVGRTLLSPQTELVSLAGQAAIGTATGAYSQSSSKGIHAAELVGTAAGIAVMAPAFAVLMAANQAHDTYVFVQKEQAKAVELKLSQVKERVEGIRSDYIAQIREEERVARQSWPDDRRMADQKSMYDAMVEADMYGTDLTESQQIRYDMEARLAEQGVETEPWFGRYQDHKKALELIAGQNGESSLSAGREFESVTHRLPIQAAGAGTSLPSSNKRFAEYARAQEKPVEKDPAGLGLR